MADISTSDFLTGLQKSGIVEPTRLADLLEDVKSETPEAIALQLVREELATKWQAKYLMSGRSRLDIGSYRLLDRINRDEFGDRFLAVHTSLARKVDIQVLPSALTKDELSRDRFIQKASLVAKLDHPNLAHVYDIDQEGGRYYLVTEHVDGKSLEETDVSKITDTMIAQIISQAIAGLACAHEHGVIHGCIGPADLMLDGHLQVKIQHLPLSPLRQQLAGNNDQPTTEQDFSAIARIGCFLLKKAEITDPSRRAQLGNAFKKLGAATPESVAEASAALEQFLADSSNRFESEVGGFDQPIGTTSARRAKKPAVSEDSAEPQEIAARGYLARLWNDNPVAVIGTSLVITLLLVGGTVYGGITWFGKQTRSDDNLVQSENPGNESDPESKKAIAANPNPDQLPRELSSEPTRNRPAPPIPTPEQMDQFLATIGDGPDQRKPLPKKNTKPKSNQTPVNETSPPAAKTDRPDVSPPVENPPDKGATQPGPDSGAPVVPDTTPKAGDPKGVDETKVVPESNKTTPPENEPIKASESPTTKPLHTDLTVISGIAEKTQTTLQKGDITSLEQLATLSPDEVQAALRKGGWGTANKISEYEKWIAQAKLKIGVESSTNADGGTAGAPDAKATFADFPRTTELPPIEDTAEVKISDLIIKKQYLLGAELICEEGAVKGRPTFELQRSNDDNQKWIVGIKKSPKDDGIPVAAFRKSESAFHFQWLPEAASDKTASKWAPYLRNCFVKLFLPEDEATVLILREPRKIHDLRITADALSNEIEIEIPAIPDADNIVVEVLPLQIPNVETAIHSSRVERGAPAEIWLKKNDKEGFLRIQVSGELRSSKLKLRSNLVLQTPGQAQPVLTMQALQELARTLDAAAVQSQMIHDQFAKPPSMKKADFDQRKADLLNNAKKQQALKQQMIEYGEILPKILNQPITVRVYAKLGNFQIPLADTDPSLEQEKE